MARMEWQDAVDVITPYIVKIHTPQGSGTGFLLAKSKKADFIGIATASHVISHAFSWEQPIKIFHHASKKTIFLRPHERVIRNDVTRDTASIIFKNTEIPFPEEILNLIPEGKFVKLGNEIGWVGFPALSPQNICFFSGRASCWIQKEESYLVDGVAINGVSGGPSFFSTHTGELYIVGIVSAYIANRATGENLPGLSLIRDVTPFQEDIKQLESFDKAKEEEQAEKSKKEEESAEQ